MERLVTARNFESTFVSISVCTKNNDIKENALKQKEIKEQYLLSRIAEGDLDCFWELWLNYKDQIRVVYVKLLKGHKSEIDDAMSSLCIRLIEQMPRNANNINNIKSWLGRAARNHFIDRHRCSKRGPHASGSLEELAAIADARSLTGFLNRETHVISRIMLEKTMQAILRIGTEQQQHAMILRFVREMSYAEIADELSVSEQLVRKWIQNTRVKLRALVDEE